MNKRYFTLPRPVNESSWGRANLPEDQRKMMEEAVTDAAEQAGLFLYNRAPEAGWESKRHTRDGKYWPCPPTTQGARPVWIWAAR
jgi:hypothetical protein